MHNHLQIFLKTVQSQPRQYNESSIKKRKDINPIINHYLTIYLLMSSNMQKEKWPLSIDRKSTRLNSSHVSSSYADFCLRKTIKQIILYSFLVYYLLFVICFLHS